MRKLFIIIILLINSIGLIYAQKYKTFTNGRGESGIKRVSDENITVHPKYKDLRVYGDSVMIAKRKDNKEAILSIDGNLLIPFSNTYTWIMLPEDDAILRSKFCEFPININNVPNKYWMYQIDNERKCIPNDYHPCPANKEKNYENSSKYLVLIDSAIVFCSRNSIDSAIMISNQAINSDLNNPYPYYWFAKMLLDTEPYGLTSKNFNMIYSNFTVECFKKALNLEKDKQRLRRILKLQKIYYQNIAKDKTKVKEIKSEIKALNREIREYIRRDYHSVANK